MSQTVINCQAMEQYRALDTQTLFGYQYPPHAKALVAISCLDCSAISTMSYNAAQNKLLKQKKPYRCRSCAKKNQPGINWKERLEATQTSNYNAVRTNEVFGYEYPVKSSSLVVVNCPGCKEEAQKIIGEFLRDVDRKCKRCTSVEGFESRKEALHSARDKFWDKAENVDARRAWAIENKVGEKLAARTNFDPEVRAKIAAGQRTVEGRRNHSLAAKAVWEKERDKMVRATQLSAPARGAKMKETYTEEMREENSIRQRERWKDPDYIENQKAAWTEERRQKLREFNQDPKNLAHLATRMTPTTEESILHFFFENLGFKVIKQQVFDHYIVDLFVPELNLIVEFNGLRWHHPSFVEGRAVKNIGRDKAKQTYLKNHYPNLKYKFLDESVLYCKGGVADFFSDLVLPIDFSFDDIEIREPNEKEGQHFLTIFHYKEVTRPALGIRYGAYYKNRLVGIAVFNSLMSPSSASSLGWNQKEMRELSRFCIHPAFHKKNFASWFLSRALHLIKKRETHLVGIVTHADTTMDHDGTIYKASNFEFICKTDRSYHYRHPDGRVMHKKSLFTQARKARLTEQAFAEMFGFEKMPELEKLKFVYWY